MPDRHRRPSCRANMRWAETTASGSVVRGFCTEVALSRHREAGNRPGRHTSAVAISPPEPILLLYLPLPIAILGWRDLDIFPASRRRAHGRSTLLH
jgi:hypothetical protein